MKLIDLLKSYALTGYVENPCHKISVFCRANGGMPNYLWEDKVPPKEWEKCINTFRTPEERTEFITKYKSFVCRRWWQI